MSFFVLPTISLKGSLRLPLSEIIAKLGDNFFPYYGYAFCVCICLYVFLVSLSLRDMVCLRSVVIVTVPGNALVYYAYTCIMLTTT